MEHSTVRKTFMILTSLIFRSPPYLDKLFVPERYFMGLDVSAVDILVKEDNGGLCTTVQEVHVEHLQLFHPGNKKTGPSLNMH